jgi:hypothetical protein
MPGLYSLPNACYVNVSSTKRLMPIANAQPGPHPMMSDLCIRRGNVADAADCGRILFEAFKAIADQHHFPPDFPNVEVATGFITMLPGHPGFHSVVAETGGRLAGCNFLDERSCIAGVGPIAVEPARMSGTLGRQLMRAVRTTAHAATVVYSDDFSGRDDDSCRPCRMTGISVRSTAAKRPPRPHPPRRSR